MERDLLSKRRQSSLSFVPHFVVQSYSPTTSTTLHYCYCCTRPYLRTHPKLAYSSVKQLTFYVYYGHCTSTIGCNRWRLFLSQWERNRYFFWTFLFSLMNHIWFWVSSVSKWSHLSAQIECMALHSTCWYMQQTLTRLFGGEVCSPRRCKSTM